MLYSQMLGGFVSPNCCYGRGSRRMLLPCISVGIFLAPRLSIDLVWISFLDPRFHKMKLLTQDEVQIARERLLEAGGGHAAVRGFPADDTDGVWGDMRRSGDENVDSRTRAYATHQWLYSTCSIEFAAYLDEIKTVSRKQNPLVW
ncbi:Integrase [Phytophthora palmivora]|uniref:Integrase n=1 Tax=Phytophthora palmivora TaxID=4796 RepID=A0A2P4YEW9_9STRA|nr:Integrase [Phytophthora palmivora]